MKRKFKKYTWVILWEKILKKFFLVGKAIEKKIANILISCSEGCLS